MVSGDGREEEPMLSSRRFWNAAWSKYFDSYSRSAPRQAFYIYFVLGKMRGRILEIGAGSFRDVVCLNRWGAKSYGVDFSQEAVRLASETFARWRGRFLVGDAFSLCFKDKMFEASYHNGFFVCFNEDEKIRHLLKEQIRVTKKVVICTVHNRLNEGLRREFQRRARKESLYDVRFFGVEEMLRLMRPFFRRIRVYPFGLPVFDRIFIRWLGLPWVGRLFYLLIARFWPLSRSERLMFVGYLE